MALSLFMTTSAFAQDAAANGSDLGTETINQSAGLGHASFGAPTLASTVGNMAAFIFSLLAVLAIVFAIVFGVVFLVRRSKSQIAADAAAARSNPAYVNLTDEQMYYIFDWSWSAFFGSFVWPLGQKLYLWALFIFLGGIFPIIPLILIYFLGRDGRRMAWEKGWPGFEQFRHRQTVMAWVVAAWVILVPIIVISLLATIAAATFASLGTGA